MNHRQDVFVAFQFEAPKSIIRTFLGKISRIWRHEPQKSRYRILLDDVIQPVCDNWRYGAFGIADVEFNGSILDKILMCIDKSIFVIVDLTFNNNGAYYEAGYARGKGKSVIHTCSKAWFEKNKVHFDVSGLNLVLYENDEDFKHKLKKRIDGSFTEWCPK